MSLVSKSNRKNSPIFIGYYVVIVIFVIINFFIFYRIEWRHKLQRPTPGLAKPILGLRVVL